jgi:hypothetical protein
MMAADHPAIIDAGNTAHLLGQKRLEPRELRIRQPEMMISHEKLPVAGECESYSRRHENPLYGS